MIFGKGALFLPLPLWDDPPISMTSNPRASGYYRLANQEEAGTAIHGSFFGGQGYATQAIFGLGNLGTFFAPPEVDDSNLIEALMREMAQLREAIEALTERLAVQEHISEQIAPISIKPRARPMSDEKAKTKIKEHFENHHGEVVYPSDIADELRLDYDRARRLISELEADGQIARV
jgi:hypothetical protein